MQINWLDFSSSQFKEIIPKICYLYFGVQPLDRQDKDLFLFGSNDIKQLAVAYNSDPYFVQKEEKLVASVFESGASAGLIVNDFLRPFEFKLFQRGHSCWFPIAFWGKAQVEAIASLNSKILSKVIPFYERLFEKHANESITGLGKGAAVWSDIVEFVSRSNSIGQKINLDPIKVRQHMIQQVNRCFRWAGGKEASHWQKVGADGWFHFYKESNKTKAIKLAVDTTELVRMIPERVSLYRDHILTVAMGVNTIEGLHLDSGGPYDDDSITAYYLLHKDLRDYDIRATQNAITSLVDLARLNEWIQYGEVKDAKGVAIDVYGHR